jgi:hypothetical protein
MDSARIGPEYDRARPGSRIESSRQIDGNQPASAQTTTMQSENLIKCAHAACRCLVEVEDEFCSQGCGDAKDAPGNHCPCGHPECVGGEQAAETGEESEEPMEVR